jgi:heterodisulfide reductase subunit D
MQLTQRQIDYCMECGVCTGSCPVSRVLPDFSPRQMIKRSMQDPDGQLLKSPLLWACLSCGRCSERCPVEIDFPEFIRSFREKARRAGNIPLESHHGMLQSIVHLQAGEVAQQRTAWTEGAGEFAETGDYFYFVGCLPYFDVIFEYLDISPADTARHVLGLLNRMGITPVISNEERCCGHDALWSGEEELFKKLASRNLDVIKASKAKTVLFSCPEGYMTFKRYYPKFFGELPFEVRHVTEFLAEKMPDIALPFQPSNNGAVTYHDPCRLGRGSGIYEPPRDLLKLIPDAAFREMPRNRENSLCCGTSAWMECSNCSKAMRIERLEEALKTGANTLITACPKCQIHLTCALSSVDMDLKVKDLYAYLSEGLQKEAK